MPQIRKEYWTAKFERTVARDAAAVEALRKLGWRVLIVWECELRDTASLERELRAYTKDADMPLP